MTNVKRLLIFSAIVVGLIALIGLLYNRITTLQDKLSVSENNVKSLLFDNTKLDSISRTLKLTINQLEYSKDSISKILIKTIENNKIKKNKITQLQYLLETNFKIDTVRFSDTVFVKDLQLDTCLCDDKWYNINLELNYPNTIIVNPKFVNEYTTVFSSKKETVYPPRKFFLWRWLQKKHYVTETKIINNNPYSSIDTVRFIEIIKR